MHPIAALSTAHGVGAVALLRVSGEDCHKILKPFLIGVSEEIRMRHSYYVRYQVDGDVLDDVIAVFFKGPASFTGEDTVEITCHGGPFVVQSILAHFWKLEINPAEPGEFSRRAFLNGKMDLTEAEGVAALIEAQSEAQWRAARSLTEGRLSNVIGTLRDELVDAMAFLEARIDFPDEGDTSQVEIQHATEKVRGVKRSIDQLIDSYQTGRVASQGLRIALIGPPNAGKSTLMNTLLGQNRAIVTNIPGTTRDFIEERCLIKGRLVSLIDTAGIRHTDDTIETVGVEHAKRLAAEADIVLLLIPSDLSPAQLKDAMSYMDGVKMNQCLKVMTKSDLDAHLQSDGDWLHISCLNSNGLTQLQDEIVKRFDGFVGNLNIPAFITSTRHLHALHSANERLQEYLEKASEAYDECLAFELQEAARALMEIVGDVSQEDVLDRVFSRFCVGK